jgi:hypothetical protein
VEGIGEPLTRSLHRTLRHAVLEHAVSERRRVFAPLLHVGTPGGSQALFAPGPLTATDHALRIDIVAALLRRTSASTGGCSGSRDPVTSSCRTSTPPGWPRLVRPPPRRGCRWPWWS